MAARLKTDLPDFTIFTDEKGRLCQVWKGKYYPETYKGYLGSGKAIIHRDVWKFYNGEIPDGHHIHHKDGDKHNNQIENLTLISRSQHSTLHNLEKSSQKSLYFQSEEAKQASRLRIKDRIEAGTLVSQSEKFKEANRERLKNRPYRDYICLNCGKQFSNNSLNAANKWCGKNCKLANWRKRKKLNAGQ